MTIAFLVANPRSCALILHTTRLDRARTALCLFAERLEPPIKRRPRDPELAGSAVLVATDAPQHSTESLRAVSRREDPRRMSRRGVESAEMRDRDGPAAREQEGALANVAQPVVRRQAREGQSVDPVRGAP